MKIIAHRGLWRKKIEQNTLIAFNRAIRFGFGIELDIRDCRGRIVVSHDLPSGKEKGFEIILKELTRELGFKKALLAVNIKSDGLENKLASLFKKYKIQKNSFVFDMSIPSQYIFSQFYKKVYFASRYSDIEKNPVLYQAAKWIWLDELEKPWINNKVIIRHVKNGKLVCIVSPELHKRPYLKAWREYRLLPEKISQKTYVCTDFPILADKFFLRRAK